LDFLRGLAVVAMVVDHMGDHSWLHAVTLGDNFYTSAAEGFVVLSGLLAGMVYRLTIQRYGLAYAVCKALRRAVALYMLVVGVTIPLILVSELLALPWSGGIGT